MLRRYFLEPLSGSVNPPWFDALGIAVGLAIGFGLPVGTQMAALGLLRVLLRFNVLAAFAFTWVNNPLTMVPMYYGYYYVGSLILGEPVLLSGEAFRSLMSPIIDSGCGWDSLCPFAHLGGDIVKRWTITAVMVGTVSASLGYAIGLHIQKGHCRHKALQMGVTYEKLVEDLEKSVSAPKRDRTDGVNGNE